MKKWSVKVTDETYRYEEGENGTYHIIITQRVGIGKARLNRRITLTPTK